MLKQHFDIMCALYELNEVHDAERYFDIYVLAFCFCFVLFLFLTRNPYNYCLSECLVIKIYLSTSFFLLSFTTPILGSNIPNAFFFFIRIVTSYRRFSVCLGFISHLLYWSHTTSLWVGYQLFYWWVNWDLEGLRNLTEVTLPVRDWHGIWT